MSAAAAERYTARMKITAPSAVALSLIAAANAASQPREPEPTPLVQEVMRQVSPQSAKGYVEKLASFGTRHTLSETGSDVRGIGAARRWIRTTLEQIADSTGGRLRVSFEEFDAPPSVRLPEGARVVNVVAVLPGSMPEAADRVYYVVGHYDSRNSDGMDAKGDAPGANDDASGTAVVMECARVLAPHKLDATVVFLCTAAEEQGLIGARYHADTARAQGKNVLGVLSNDVVGDPLGPGGDASKTTRELIRVFSEGIPRNATPEELARIRALAAENDSTGRQLARFIASVARRERTAVRPMLVFRLDRFLRGGDHSVFAENGFPAVRFTEVHEDYARQHQDVRVEEGKQIGDLPEFVDAAYLADVARLNAAALVHLANAPRPPANVRVITAELEYGTTLRWDRSPEPDVAGYEVVWRATTSADWEHVRDVGDASEARIDESKDNVFFGVRAYDREGYRSPVSFAGAARE